MRHRARGGVEGSCSETGDRENTYGGPFLRVSPEDSCLATWRSAHLTNSVPALTATPTLTCQPFLLGGPKSAPSGFPSLVRLTPWVVPNLLPGPDFCGLVSVPNMMVILPLNFGPEESFLGIKEEM